MSEKFTVLMTVRDLSEDEAEAIVDQLNDMDENNYFPSGAAITVERGF